MMELDEVIITVPKTGIFLSERIKVIPPRRNHVFQDVQANEDEQVGRRKHLFPRGFYLTWICTSMMFTLFIIYIFFFKDLLV